MIKKEIISFSELAESKEFFSFFNVFRKLTGIRIVLTNPSLTKSKWFHNKEDVNPICKLIKSTTEGKARCNECDRVHGEKAKHKRGGIEYICHAGFIDFVVPIYISGELIAYFYGGQILLGQPTEKRFERFLKKNKDLNINPELLRKYYLSSPFLPRDKFREALDLLTIFANYFCEIGTRLKTNNKKTRSEVEKAKEYIQKHFRGPVTLAEVAEHVSLSEAYFGVLFKKETGTNFTHYIQHIRVSEAEKLLEKTEMPITKIAFAVGFENTNHYNRVFRKFNKCTPREYRRNLKQ